MSPIEFTVIRDDAGFRSLEGEWRRLSEAAAPTHFFQSFDWCWQAWASLVAKTGRQLHIVVGRAGGEAVLILPLMRAGPFLRVLGADLFEFHDALVLPSSLRIEWLHAALEFAGSLGGSGFLLRDARQDGDLTELFGCQAVGRSRLAGKTSFVKLTEFPSWGAYFETLPKHLKSDQRRQWKRLGELPEPGRFEIVEDAAKREALLSWLHSEKIKWLDAHKGMSGGGLYGSDNYRHFLLNVVGELGARGQVMLCRIASGNDTLAALLGIVHRGYFVFFMFGYDPEWSGYSPGRLVMAKAIEWSFANNIETFDMLLGEEDYKATWATHTMPIRDYFVPLNFQGRFIEKWHDSGCSEFFAEPWLSPLYRLVPGRLRQAVGGRLAAQRELIAEMKRL